MALRGLMRKRIWATPTKSQDILQTRAFSSRLLERYLQVDRRVQEALQNGEPVVALESTIVAHGMPYPQNLETAEDVEAIVRSKV
jgi:pseudouridine-5'-phosphate glycosidase